jgi:hypothetical protein
MGMIDLAIIDPDLAIIDPEKTTVQCLNLFWIWK